MFCCYRMIDFSRRRNDTTKKLNTFFGFEVEMVSVQKSNNKVIYNSNFALILILPWRAIKFGLR